MKPCCLVVTQPCCTTQLVHLQARSAHTVELNPHPFVQIVKDQLLWELSTRFSPSLSFIHTCIVSDYSWFVNPNLEFFQLWQTNSKPSFTAPFSYSDFFSFWIDVSYKSFIPVLTNPKNKNSFALIPTQITHRCHVILFRVCVCHISIIYYRHLFVKFFSPKRKVFQNNCKSLLPKGLRFRRGAGPALSRCPVRT